MTTGAYLAVINPDLKTMPVLALSQPHQVRPRIVFVGI
jgi:hypothetical protein